MSRLQQFAVCIECSSDWEIDWWEHLDQLGKIKHQIIEPCRDHRRLLLFHVPATPEDHESFERGYVRHRHSWGQM